MVALHILAVKGGGGCRLYTVKDGSAIVFKYKNTCIIGNMICILKFLEFRNLYCFYSL